MINNKDNQKRVQRTESITFEVDKGNKAIPSNNDSKRVQRTESITFTTK